jgi:hypothetical protein
MAKQDPNQVLPSADASGNLDSLPVPETLSMAMSNTAGPSLAEVLEAQGVDGKVFCDDPRSLEYTSTAPAICTQPAYDEQKAAEMREIAFTNGALQNSQIQRMASPEYKGQLKHIAEASKKLPTCDAITFAEGQKISLSADVRDLPNSIGRQDGLEIVKAMVGHERMIAVLRWARTAGPAFVAQPLGWLSQMIAVSSKTMTYADELPEWEFPAEVLAADDNTVFDTIMRLFTRETAQNIRTISRMNRESMIYVFNVLVKKACDDREAIVKPSAVTQIGYTDQVEEQAS